MVKGLFFSESCSLSERCRIAVANKYGFEGLGVFCELMEQISKDKGYYLVLDSSFIEFMSMVGTVGRVLIVDVITLLVSLGFFEKGLSKRSILTSREIQEFYVKKTRKRKSIKPEYCLLEPEADTKAVKKPEQEKSTFPRELYTAAFELYEEEGKLPNYPKEASHLKHIFTWLSQSTPLTVETVKGMVKAHRWAIYESGDKFWATQPFLPTGLSYNMFTRLIQLTKGQQSQHDKTLRVMEERRKRLAELKAKNDLEERKLALEREKREADRLAYEEKMRKQGDKLREGQS